MNQHETKQTGAALRLFVYMILIAALLLPASATTAQAAPVQQDTPVEQVSAAAVGTTYTVTSTSCTGPGSITEAMASANNNPGEDTITFTPGLQIEASQCLPGFSGAGLDYFMVQATESVTFEGNGARLVGHIQWITTGGLDTPIGPSAGCHDAVGDQIIALTPGFIKVGAYGQDNSAITVTVRDLDMHELNSVARIEKNASLILEDLTLNRIIAGYRDCYSSAIDADEGANFTARRTEWDTIWNGTKDAFTAPDTTIAAISGVQGPLNNRIYAGNLNIEDSYFKDVYKGTINWGGQAGDKANIVTSRFEEAGGIHISGAAETNIVNSILSGQAIGPSRVTDHLINSSTQEMNIIASTVLFPDVECDSSCQRFDVGWIYRQPGRGKINFIQSAVGVNFPDTVPAPATRLLDPDTKLRPFPGVPGPGFTADEYTWIQPTSQQPATALQAVTAQQNLRTNPPGLPIEGSYTLAEWATPLDPGELIDKIDNAECTEGNQLLNPIDNTCITVDALGNPRVDANGKRNIGAVQLTLAPYLTVTGTGDGTVDLSWTKPQVSSPSTITGYELRYRATGAASWTTVPVSGPDTLTRQVTSLTNGTQYEFEVRATYSPSGEGPYSNTARATPLGPIGTPVVAATPGNGQVDLSWTLPSDGGHVIDAYSILWRPTGTTNWIGAKGIFGTAGTPPGTQTTITGLTNGTAYEFAVTANALDGAIGPQGLATATPYAPGRINLSKYSYPAGGTGFRFTQNVDNSGDFTLNDEGRRRFSSVAPGSYTVTEADPQALGYQLSGVSCAETDPNGISSSGDVTTRTATINVDSGETVSCFFQNGGEETVIIEKRTLPSGGSGFAFSDDIGTPNSFSLDDAQTRTFTHVPVGKYQVTEGAMPGYELTAIDCTVEGVSVPGDLASRTAKINLTQAGGSAQCTFTNTKLGTLIMRKETLPDGATDTFDYSISGPDTSDSGSLTDGTATQVDNAKSGTWELTESLPTADWHLGDISCTSTLGASTFTKDIDNLKATVQLAPGDTMDCTFTNVQADTITVEKVTLPTGDATTAFDFTGSGSIGGFALKDGEQQTFTVDPNAGPFTLIESDPSGAGYGVTEIRCVNTQTGGVTLGDPDTRSVELNTQPGESQHCTFTNQRHGQVVIRKATAPGGGSGFGFYGGFGSFSLDDGKAETILDVTPGAYSVSEADPSGLGYGLSGIKCSDSDPNGTASTGNLATHTASINVDAGETVTCTFTNSQLDTVSVFKVTLPPGGTGFDFGGTFGPFTLDDGQLTTFNNVAPGANTINEDDPTPGYDLALILCYDASTGQFFQGDVANRKVDLDLDVGHQVLCEFFSVQRGTIIIEKAPGSGTGYDFSGDLGDFSLDSGDEKTFINQPVGQYSASEQTPAGDTLTGLTCTDSDANGVASTGDVASSTATINLDPGETVRCTYTNQPGGSVVIKKAVASGPAGPFTFLDNIQTPATFDLSDGGEQRFDNVLSGIYTVQETALPAGSGLAQISCVDSNASGTPSSSDLSAATAVINLDPGETVECTFTNESNLGTVIIRKGTAPAGGSGFAFSGSFGDFTLDDGGNQTISNVQPGNYTVTESDPSASGYELSGLTCVDSDQSGTASSGSVASRTATINVDPGETVTCTFTNAEDDTITVEKVTIPASTDSFGFGGDLGDFDVVGGSVKDFTNVSPGSYTLTETDPSAGGYVLRGIECVDSATGQTFPGDPAARSVNLTLVAGERVHCTFTNTGSPTDLDVTDQPQLPGLEKNLYLPQVNR